MRYERGMPLRTTEDQAMQRGATALRKIAYSFARRDPPRARAGSVWHDDMRTILAAMQDDKVNPSAPSEKAIEAALKVCPDCDYPVFAGLECCPACGRSVIPEALMAGKKQLDLEAAAPEMYAALRQAGAYISRTAAGKESAALVAIHKALTKADGGEARTA